VVNGFKQAIAPEAAVDGRPANILHGTHFVLVDGEGVIRGFYSSDDEGLKALANAARQLVNEGPH
jgi:protein SCO1